MAHKGIGDNEKAVGMELRKTVELLEKSKSSVIEQLASTISIAADAGDIIASARVEGLEMTQVLQVGQINNEQARRLERVAKARPALKNPEPSQLRQLMLWSGVIPDPIQNSSPKTESHWLSYIFKARQWITKKDPKNWSEDQKAEFIKEAEPIARAWREAGGRED